MKRMTQIFCLAVIVAAGAGWLGLAPLGAQAPNRAGVVVRFGDGSVVTRCVEFNEPEISGYDLLTRSGLAVVAGFDPGAGAAICKIEHEGCPADNCFCSFPPNFWSYWHLIDGQWMFSQRGSSVRQVHSGDMDGWSWGAGTAQGGVAPPAMSFDQVCAPPSPTETPTLPPTSTDVPTVPPAPTQTPPPPTPQPVVWFRLDNNPIQAGQCTLVRWDTSGIQSAVFNGEPVALIGERQVCPTAPQTFVLRVVTDGGAEETHTLELGVLGGAPDLLATATIQPSPQSTRPPTWSPTPTARATRLPTATRTGAPAVAPAIAPSYTPTRAPAVTPLPSASPFTTPTLAPTLPSATLIAVAISSQPQQLPSTPESPAAQSSQPLPLLGYVVFAVIVVGLVALLLGRRQVA